MSRNIYSNIVNLVLVLVGVIFFVSAQSIQTGSAMAQSGDFMPKLMSFIWLILSIVIFISGLKEDVKKEETNVQKFVATLVLLFVYMFLLKRVGFVISSILYTFIQMMLFVTKEERNVKNYIIFGIIAVVIPIAVNLLFANVFSLILPEGTIFK